LLYQGKRQEAILLFREQLEISEDDAQNLVTSLEREVGKPGLAAEHMKKSASLFFRGFAPFMLKSLGYTFGFFGLMTLAVAGYAYYVSNHFAGKALKLEGTVVNFRYDDDGSLAPVVEYQLDKAIITCDAEFYSSTPGYEVGDKVVMLINPDDPKEAVIDSFSERYATSITIGMVGAFFTGLAVYMFRAANKYRRHKT
jgi:hypothetical protein